MPRHSFLNSRMKLVLCDQPHRSFTDFLLLLFLPFLLSYPVTHRVSSTLITVRLMLCTALCFSGEQEQREQIYCPAVIVVRVRLRACEIIQQFSSEWVRLSGWFVIFIAVFVDKELTFKVFLYCSCLFHFRAKHIQPRAETSCLTANESSTIAVHNNQFHYWSINKIFGLS